jgi:hypothetical protein
MKTNRLLVPALLAALPKITAWLIQQGYTEQQIANMWSGNLLRVMAEAQRIGKELQAAQAMAAPAAVKK